MGGEASVLRDLSRPSLRNIKDKYSVWEYGTAFKITSFQAFKLAVEGAEAAEGCQGYVTLPRLVEELHTQGWAELKKPSSQLANVLTSAAFRNPKKKQSEGQIDTEILLMYGILHCQDGRRPTNKANAFYEIL